MEARRRIGSYDHDRLVNLPATNREAIDCVRCVCGCGEEEGSMVQCDACQFWLHADCVQYATNEDFKCAFCTHRLTRTPAVDVPLKTTPDFAFANCTYFRALVNSRGLQVRLNEARFSIKKNGGVVTFVICFRLFTWNAT